jgi:dihydroflavonol-4-reductase
MSHVLVTGGSGFVGSHAIRALLDAGHGVRTTVRSLAREETLRALVGSGGHSTEGLQVVEADLMGDAGWSEAARGCEYVLHVASPLPATQPKRKDELVGPAREGTLRVLKAARAAGVKRVVLTSSFAAVGYGHEPRKTPFTEVDWTEELKASDVQPYIRSKVLAERAAWDFMEREGGSLELTVINPVAILGPVLGADFASSVAIVHRMLAGTMPACPRIYFGVVDVRDVVDLHLRAMTAPNAKGQRFLATAGDPLSLFEIANILHQRLGDAAQRAPHKELPNFLVRALALFKPELRGVVPQLGKVRRASSAKAQTQLGWRPRSSEDTVVATGESLVSLGLV